MKNENIKLWEGRTDSVIDVKTNDFNSSIKIDSRMYKQDILGSIAHVSMLAKQDIITKSESQELIKELNNIKNEIEEGSLLIDFSCEDIHTFVEIELTKRLKDTGKKLHTARSRNDQVALDIKMYLKEEVNQIICLLNSLIKAFISKAEENLETVMPGYTHMQRAQPIVFAHHMMAYVEMFLRDIDRLKSAYKRLDCMPLGSLALAGTTYNIDREYVKDLLSFESITRNSLDSVSDRDFCIELLSCFSIIMMHLSRISEEIIIWCSWEFKFVELSNSFSTGSSIMPQKKNPDVTELIRGKTGRVYGDLITVLTMMKGLPLAYNKDMQEDKEAIFDSIDTLKMCMDIFIPLLNTMKVNKDNMKKAALEGFINATDCADYLVKKGMPFRDAYKITGKIVSYCMENNKTLDNLKLEEYKMVDMLFEEDIYNEIDLLNCVKKRNVVGGTSPEQIKKEIDRVKKI